MTFNEGIFHSTSVLVFVTLAVKLVGIIKQSIIAHTFGVGETVDAFFLASSFIDGIGTIIFSAVSVYMTSAYLETKQRKGMLESQVLVGNLLLVFMTLSVVMGLILCWGAPWLARILAPGFQDEARINVGTYMRALSLALPGICIANICGAVLNAEKRFLPKQVLGLIQSASMIAACLFVTEYIAIWALVVGFCAYYILQNVYLLYCCRTYILFGFRKWFTKQWLAAQIRLCMPLIISNALLYVNGFVDKAIASGLEIGSIAALSYSYFVFSSVHAIVINNLCVVLFSYLAMYVAEKKIEKASEAFRQSLLILGFFMGYITLLLFGHSDFFVSLLYAHGGQFGVDAVEMTSSALRGYSLGLVFLAIRDLAMQMLYAFQRFKEAMLSSVVGVGVNIFFSVYLSNIIGVFGIALADGISFAVAAVSMGWTFKRFSVHVFSKEFIPEGIKFLLTAFLAIKLSSLIVHEAEKGLSFSANIVQILLTSILYFGLAFLFKMQAIEVIKSLFWRRIEERNG